MRVAFYTLGCKVNQYETEVMQSQFSADGFDIVDFNDEADIYIVNSCTVTETGDKKSKSLIKKARKQNNSAVLVLIGCFPQAFPEKASILENIDVVQGSHNRNTLLDNVKKYLSNGEKIIDITKHKKGEEFEKMKVTNLHEHTRAFVKIEDGCDRYCSYCIIPTARGHIRSKSLEDLKEEVTELANNGYKEIVLVGINLSSYGKEQQYKIRLIDAIKCVADIDKIKRVRLGSLEPELLLEEDIKQLSQIDKFCPQFHLSLQSGSEDTLKRMNRHYTPSEYKTIVNIIRDNFENPAITTDIMVGFAGEDEREFDESVAFAKDIGFSKMHVFSYSIRSGTRAENFPNQVLKADKDKRSKKMIEVANQLQEKFLQTQIGSIQEVLFESKVLEQNVISERNLVLEQNVISEQNVTSENKYENSYLDKKISNDTENTNVSYIGYTKNYSKVIIFCKNCDKDLTNQIVKVKIEVIDKNHCIGTIV